jgi:hypothetical protein
MLATLLCTSLPEQRGVPLVPAYDYDLQNVRQTWRSAATYLT